MQGLAKFQELRRRLRLNASLEASSELAGGSLSWNVRAGNHLLTFVAILIVSEEQSVHGAMSWTLGDNEVDVL